MRHLGLSALFALAGVVGAGCDTNTNDRNADGTYNTSRSTTRSTDRGTFPTRRYTPATPRDTYPTARSLPTPAR